MYDGFSSGGHNTPSTDAQQDLTVLGYDSDQSTYVTVKYTRKLNTNDKAGKDVTFAFGQTSSWTYSWKSGSLKLA
jgi:hypothetical protein